MSEIDVDRTVRRVLGEHGRLSEDAATIGDDQDLYVLGLTSHATVTVVMALEDELDIEFPDALLTKSTFATVRSLREAIQPMVEA